MKLQEKLNKLQQAIQKTGRLAVAFSGGTDSAFLLKVAHDVLRDNLLALTADSPAHPERELKEALSFAARYGIKHIVFSSDDADFEALFENPRDRCYLCKKSTLAKIITIAGQHNIHQVAEGSNMDDLTDDRPGSRAVKELNVLSPLMEAGLHKDDIRRLSEQMNLPTWDKPAFACLLTRFPYGQPITRQSLEMVDKAEQYLLDLGFRQVRVRHHGDVARIEVSAEEKQRFFDKSLMEKIDQELKSIGFVYTSLDLRGYRTGSMNESVKNR